MKIIQNTHYKTLIEITDNNNNNVSYYRVQFHWDNVYSEENFSSRSDAEKAYQALTKPTIL
jgi:hypothetical protein